MSGGRPTRFGAAAEALFRLDRATAVAAGAGSGKTTALVELCVRLLSGEASGTACAPSQIAAITFTERAAAELGERLRQAVAERAREARAGPPSEARAWAKRLHELDGMPVGTIHAFAAGLLREHAVEASVDPDFTVLDEEAAAALRQEAARAAVVAAVDAGRPLARTLCAAHGAGGRGPGLAEMVAELVRERATLGLAGPPEPVPSDPGAARQARDVLLAAVRSLLAHEPGPATASGCKALAALEAALAALPCEDREGDLGLAGAGRLAALAALLRPWRLGKGEGEALRVARQGILRAGEALPLFAAQVLARPQEGELCALVAEAEARYAASKVKGRSLDFDDLLVRARDLLRRDRALRWELRARTRALLVDEYQDVNGLQQEIFDLLAGEDPAGADAPPPALLVAVGDAKQSIYRFRGADVGVFAGLLERLGASARGRVLHLYENHRSTPGVLDLVNAVFERSVGQGGAGFPQADRLVPVRRGGMAPACEILEDGEGGLAAERRAREARAVAERVRAIVSGAAGLTVTERGPAGEERVRPPRLGEVALLFRRLTQIGEYERALRAAGVPYRLARGGGFYQAPEVRDLGELLASLFEPGDPVAWAALLRSPFCGVSEGTLFLASRLGLGALWRREPEEVVEAIRGMWVRSTPTGTPTATATASPTLKATPTATLALTPTEAATLDAELERLHRFLAEWRALRALLDRLSPADLIARAAERLDLEAALLSAPEGERRLGNLRKALVMARRFAEGGGGAPAFAARLRDMAERLPREPEAELEAGDAVAVLSIHQAKGLEWPVVLVPDVGARPRSEARRALLDAEGRVCARFFDLASEAFHPTAATERALGEARRATAAESNRLLYVALTRAREYLVLSGLVEGENGWSALVEAAAPGRALRVPAGEAATFLAGPAVAAPPPLQASPEPLALPPRLAPPAPLPAVRLAVTDFAEYARCPRRHFLSRRLRLPERGGAGEVADDPAQATARGTLAHALLAELDFAAPPLERRAQLAASASRRGYRPESQAVRRILADISRFLESPPGRRLAAVSSAGALRREVPFLLRLDGRGEAPACYLTGAIDALAADEREVAIIDFKYAVGRPGSEDRYRVQLLAYALATSRAFPGRRVRASLQFLRGGLVAADLTPSAADLARFADEAPRLASGAFRGEGEGRSPAELGRTEARCRAEGCGYVPRCFRARSIATRTPTPTPTQTEAPNPDLDPGPDPGRHRDRGADSPAPEPAPTVTAAVPQPCGAWPRGRVV